jgi:hypothetical protein
MMSITVIQHLKDVVFGIQSMLQLDSLLKTT